MSDTVSKSVFTKVYEYVKNSPMTDLGKIARVTRLDRISKGKALLIATVVTVSTFACGSGHCNSAGLAHVPLVLGEAVKLSGGMSRLGGIPYRNRDGKVVVSGSVSDDDYRLGSSQIRAQLAYDMARANEPVITMDMLEIADANGATMEGLEYSIKTGSSMQNKIDRKTHKALDAGAEPKAAHEYVYEFGDIIRYTQVVPHMEMADKTKHTVKLLEAKGYRILEVDNKYLNKEGRYKAIHINAVSPNGQKFEIQMHSPETLQANSKTHELYEEWRHPDTAEARKAALYQEIKNIYDALPLPQNIESVASYKVIA